MTQSAATIERAAGVTPGSPESTVLARTADHSQSEDDLFDSWLASMGDREFELILNALAEDDIAGLFALDPTA
jgi:hypothetical protein